MSKLIAVVMLALSASLLIGCGGDDNGGSGSSDGTTSSSGDSSDDRPSGSGALTSASMCKLLARAEIEAAVGNKVEEGVPDIGISCDWDSDPDDVSVALFLLPIPDPKLCESALSGDAVYKPASGFGSPAFASYNAPFGGSADVVVCHKRGQLQLVVTGGLDDTNNEQMLRTAASDLMKKVLSRL